MITSTSNPHIKSLRKLTDSKERAATNTFLAEGLRVVGQAVDSGAQIQQLLYCDELLVSDYGRKLVTKLSEEPSVEIIDVSKEVFKSLARKDKPQGIYHKNPSFSVCYAAAVRRVQNLPVCRRAYPPILPVNKNWGSAGCMQEK